jgi:hypothetical protein
MALEIILSPTQTVQNSNSSGTATMPVVAVPANTLLVLMVITNTNEPVSRVLTITNNNTQLIWNLAAKHTSAQAGGAGGVFIYVASCQAPRAALSITVKTESISNSAMVLRLIGLAGADLKTQIGATVTGSATGATSAATIATVKDNSLAFVVSSDANVTGNVSNNFTGAQNYAGLNIAGVSGYQSTPTTGSYTLNAAYGSAAVTHIAAVEIIPAPNFYTPTKLASFETGGAHGILIPSTVITADGFAFYGGSTSVFRYNGTFVPAIADGYFGAKIECIAGDSYTMRGWNTPGYPTAYTSCYYYFPSYPAASATLISIVGTINTLESLKLPSDGKLITTSGTAIFDNPVPLNTLLRIEYGVMLSTEGAGVVTIQIFAGNDTTPIDGYDVTLSNLTHSEDVITTVRFGVTNSTTLIGNYTFYLDRFAYSPHGEMQQATALPSRLEGFYIWDGTKEIFLDSYPDEIITDTGSQPVVLTVT